MIVNGRKIAEEILADTKKRVIALNRPVRVIALTTDASPATQSYLKIKIAQAAKAGIEMVAHQYERRPTTLALAATVDQAAVGVDAIIVQLPLPPEVDTTTILNAIPADKDADILSQAARQHFGAGAFVHPAPLMPPVASAIKEILMRAGVDPRGKRAAVVGAGWLVGQPAAVWLEQAGAQVEILTQTTPRFGETLINADIIVSGAGSPGIIARNGIKAGAVIIDAGTSESNGQLVGDADPACAEIASVFTPVPGGVGPIAVACLFQNVVTLAEHRDTPK